MKTHPNRCHINCFPFQRHIGCFEDLLHGSRNFRSDTIARDQCDFAHIARIWAAAIDWCKVYLSNGEKKTEKQIIFVNQHREIDFIYYSPFPYQCINIHNSFWNHLFWFISHAIRAYPSYIYYVSQMHWLRYIEKKVVFFYWHVEVMFCECRYNLPANNTGQNDVAVPEGSPIR